MPRRPSTRPRTRTRRNPSPGRRVGPAVRARGIRLVARPGYRVMWTASRGGGVPRGTAHGPSARRAVSRRRRPSVTAANGGSSGTVGPSHRCRVVASYASRPRGTTSSGRGDGHGRDGERRLPQAPQRCPRPDAHDEVPAGTKGRNRRGLVKGSIRVARAGRPAAGWPEDPRRRLLPGRCLGRWAPEARRRREAPMAMRPGSGPARPP